MNFTDLPPISKGITIQGNLFFPSIDFDLFVSQYRIASELPKSMVENALIRAYGNTEKQLETFVIGAKRLGHKKLSEVDSIKINSISILEAEFIRAVACFAKAELLRESPSMIRIKAAENAAKSADETEAFYQELAQLSLAKIWGISGRINVETI